MKCPHCNTEIFDMGVTISEILHDEKIPGVVKNLIIPFLQKLKGLEREIAGSIELAYRRGIQAGKEMEGE